MITADSYLSIKTEGSLLPSDILERIAKKDDELGGFLAINYNLAPNERLNEIINRSWNRVRGVWDDFSKKAEQLSDNSPDSAFTREKWLLVLFSELGFGRLQPLRSSLDIEGKSYPISHMWERVPIHLVGFRTQLDKREPGKVGAARSSPYSMLQEFINRGKHHRWGMVSNGLTLRLLRNNSSLVRQSYVEFNLSLMMENELFSDFVLLWMICHRSRFEEIDGDCWLEKWVNSAQTQGARALDNLRMGVENAISALGTGFIKHKKNQKLRESLRGGEISPEDYYHQLLRLVYRSLFLFTAEDRDLLLKPNADRKARETYYNYYSMQRLRNLSRLNKGTKHDDLYEIMKTVSLLLGSESDCDDLGISPLGSFLWSVEAVKDIHAANLSNEYLLSAIRSIGFFTHEGTIRPIDYRNLGSEELGSVYESLLELHPEIDLDVGGFTLTSAEGNARKTTGSYYTPSTLVQCLLDSALDPVIDDAIKNSEDPEKAILALKICDPAAGSGHFLVAAAHRIAKRLATIRTGDDQPSPVETKHSLRDVIQHCIYGVDINPMAVELCKVTLWLEALEPGKPLSFLDHRIKCGNSLLTTTSRLMEDGIPDSAFEVLVGDDVKTVKQLKKINSGERKGNASLDMFFGHDDSTAYNTITNNFILLDGLAEDSIHSLIEKEKILRKTVHSQEYLNSKFIADAWCSAFVQKSSKNQLASITHHTFREIQKKGRAINPSLAEIIESLSSNYNFFHWHLEFPEVFLVEIGTNNKRTGYSGGFDCVLGNPPWERVKIQEKEFFAKKDTSIAQAPNAAKRKKMIDQIKESDPQLYKEFLEESRVAEGTSHLLRRSGMYPLCGRGDVNLYTVFVELKRTLLNERGRLGTIIPTGIATDDTTKFFFQDVTKTKSLVSLYDFENKNIFPDVHSSYKFCLFTAGSGLKPLVKQTDFVFFAHSVDDLDDDNRHFSLSEDDIELLNPNTKTCPIFRTKKDAELTKAIYRRVPILLKEKTEDTPEINPWGVNFKRMFDMSNDSHLFKTREELENEGWTLNGNIFYKNNEKYLPLYEAKMIHQYDHRWATYKDNEFVCVPEEQKKEIDYQIFGRYWVTESVVEERLQPTGWKNNFLIGYRDITRATDEKTVIASIFPRCGASGVLPQLFISKPEASLIITGLLNSFVVNYSARQKVGGVHLSLNYLKQLPIIEINTLKNLNRIDEINNYYTLLNELLTIIFSYHKEFNFHFISRDYGNITKWDPTKRIEIKSIIDAIVFFTYFIPDDNGNWTKNCNETEEDHKLLIELFPQPVFAIDYIMSTFPIVKRKDEKNEHTNLLLRSESIGRNIWNNYENIDDKYITKNLIINYFNLIVNNDIKTLHNILIGLLS